MIAWNTNDKDWMKQRREKWKNIQPRIKLLLSIEKEEKKVLKKYFLTGEEDEQYPITKMACGPLLEMWLHPDQSEEHWRQMKEENRYWDEGAVRFSEEQANRRWGASRGEFFNMAKGIEQRVPEGESFFDGLEERLCRWFKFDTLNREDWPEWSDEVYLKECKKNLRKVRGFDNYLKNPNPNPYDITRYQVPIWREAMIHAFEEDYLGLEWMIEYLCAVLKEPEKCHELVVDFANQLEAAIADPRMPKAALEVINQYKTQYGCPVKD